MVTEGTDSGGGGGGLVGTGVLGEGLGAGVDAGVVGVAGGFWAVGVATPVSVGPAAVGRLSEEV